MTLNINKTLRVAGISLFSMLAITGAIAGPPKHKKPPTSTKVTAATIAAGKKVYDGNGCMACHKIGDKGGESAPNLSNEGGDAKHTVKWLTTQVSNPKTNNPDSTMPPYAEKIKGKNLTNLAGYLGSLKMKK